MVAGLTGFKRWIFLGVVALAALLVAAAIFYRHDILRTALDPKVPFQTYDPPPAPDYARPGAWAMLAPTAGRAAETDLPVDVFFVHPTTYNGGGNWNAPLDKEEAARQLAEQMLPNYAGPFARVGRIFAPRYRQASLYTRMTLRDDAREARRFAYGDVRAAFQLYRDRYNQGRPFIVVGVEQGGELVARLLAEEVAPNEALRSRLAAAYLIATVVPPRRAAVAGLHREATGALSRRLRPGGGGRCGARAPDTDSLPRLERPWRAGEPWVQPAAVREPDPGGGDHRAGGRAAAPRRGERDGAGVGRAPGLS